MNLWDKAVDSLKEKDKQNVDFQRSNKRAILLDLLGEIQKKKQLCIERRMKYKRKNGQSVVLYDVFEKIVNWVNKFKDIGDVAMQYDPGHAALPWAGIRFFLQVLRALQGEDVSFTDRRVELLIMLTDFR
jgi:hypothetical protein